MSRSFRLAVYSDSDQLGGAEVSLATLLEHLGAQIDVTVLGISRDVVDRIAGGRPDTDTQVLPAVRSKRDARSILAHLSALRALRPDVFHANLTTPWSCLYGLVAALLTQGVRTVAVEHLPTPPPNRRFVRYKRLTSARLAAHAAVGERSAREVERLAGLPPGSIRTIHNGVPDLDRRSVERLRAGPIVGFAGRFDRQKGLDVLLHALTGVPDVTAVLVGDGPERPRLERLARELSVADRVVLTGWVPNAGDYLSSFDVLALPSRFEAFPLVVLEAMVARVPVVATNVGSIAEAVVDGETGLLVPPEDSQRLGAALLQLLGDPERRARMGDRGRERALKRFSAGAMAAAFEALYEEILE